MAQPGTVQTHDRVGADYKIFRSTVVGDIGLLKSEVDALKLELQELRSNSKCEGIYSDLDTCILYIRLKKSAANELNKALLETELNTCVIDYDIIRSKPTPASRVKVRKSLLYHAISHARANDCIADLWRGTQSKWIPGHPARSHSPLDR